MSGPSAAPSAETLEQERQPHLTDLDAAVATERQEVRHALEALSEKNIERLKSTFREWINQMYETVRMGSHETNPYANFNELIERINNEVQPGQGQQAAFIFFNQFIDFAIAIGKKDQLDELLKQLSRSVAWESLSNPLGFSNYMHLLARMSRTRGFMHMVDNSIQHECSPNTGDTEFNMCRPVDIEVFARSIIQLSISKQLEMIGFLEFLGFSMIGEDDEGITPHFLIRIFDIILAQTSNALTHHIALLSKQRVEKAIVDMKEWTHKSIHPEFFMSDREIAIDRGLKGKKRKQFIDSRARERIEAKKERQQGEGILYQRFNQEDSWESRDLLRKIYFLMPLPDGTSIPLEEFPDFLKPEVEYHDLITFNLEQCIIDSRIKYEDRVGRDIRPLRISSDYIGIFDDSSLVRFVTQCEKLPVEKGKKIQLLLAPLEEVTHQLSFNPFHNVSTEDIPLLLQQLHRPRMREMIERVLGLKLEEMPLATQFQLLQFMAEESEETFVKLRTALPGEGASRQHFLTAFLACSKARNYGHKILELAERYPDKAGKIFERFYQIISISQQEEKKLERTLTENPALSKKPNIAVLYQTMISRGAELLSEAYEKINDIQDIEDYLQEAKRYQLKLIAFRGIFDAITAEDMHVSPSEIEQLTADKIKAEIRNGGQLLSFKPEGLSDQELSEKMLDETNYSNPSHFSKADYEMIVRNIRSTYKGIDEEWAEYLIGRLPYHLMNPDSNFILIRNEEGELVGIGRSDKLGENHYYMGTFYVEDGYQGIGRYIGEYLETELPPGVEIEGTTAPANKATMWHIEINGYVGKKIVHEGGSGPLIECSNFPKKTFITKDKEKFSQHAIKSKGEGDLEEGQIKILKVDTRPGKASASIQSIQPLLENEGYVITRFFYDNSKAQEPAAHTWIVLEKGA